MEPYRVLSLDGGGVRGLYTALLLEGLGKRFNPSSNGDKLEPDVGSAFDLIVGTSTGAILATAMASGVPLSSVISLYRSKAKQIFPDPIPPADKPMKLFSWILRHLGKPGSDGVALRDAFREVLGDETVKEMYDRRGIALCIPAIDASSHKAWVFKTPHDTQNGRLGRDNAYSLIDVCMASAAAPMVLPIHGVQKPEDPAHSDWFVDGGLWANNPIMVALTEALEFAPENASIEVISVSTCPPFQAPIISTDNSHRGLSGWTAGIGTLEMALDSQSSAYHYMAQTLSSQFSDRISYLRLEDPSVSSDWAEILRLDNPSEQCLNRLTKLGHQAVDLNFSKATAREKESGLLKKILSDLPQVTT